MNNLITEAEELQSFIQSKGLEFFFIGGLAVQVWGEPRLTRDIDLTVFTNLLDERSLIKTFLQEYAPKFSDADEFALTNRVLPMQTGSGTGIDLLLGGLADISEPLKRSSYQKFTDKISLRVCSPDDLIIMKTAAARSRDWFDIESVIIKQPKLEWNYIDQSLESLRDYDDIEPKITQLRSLRDRFRNT